MKKQAVALIFANGINFLVNFVTSPFLARKLSYADNGTFGQINLLNGYLTVLFGLGIVSIINLLLVEYKNNENKVLNANFWIQLGMGLACAFSVYIFSQSIAKLFNNENLSEYLILYLPSTIFIILTNGFIYYYVHFDKAESLSYITVGLNLIRVIAIYYAVNILNSLYYTIILINVVNMVGFFTYTFFMRKWFFPLSFPQLSVVKYIIKLGYPYLGLSIIGYSILNINGVVVSNLLGVEKFAIYRNGALEIPFVATLYTSVAAVTMPRMVEYIKNGNNLLALKLKRNTSLAVALMIYPLVFFCIFNGQELIELYLGDKYIESGIIFSIINIAVLIRINNYSDILTIKKKPLKVIYPNIYTLVISLLLVFPMVKFFGIEGPAISYVLSILLLSIFLILNSAKELEASFFDYFDFKKLAIISAVCIFYALISSLFMNTNIVTIITLGVLYTIFVYLTLWKLKLIDADLLPESVNRLISKVVK